MAKQYFVKYKSNKIICGTNIHIVGYVSTIRGAKAIIRNIRKNYSEEDPKDFKVFDSYAELDKETNFVPCVYCEE